MVQESAYKAMTRERFLFQEMRITARLLGRGMGRQEAIQEIAESNLFQYPTEKSLRPIANVCMNRLEALGSQALVAALATSPVNDAKQICLYSVMRQNRLFYEFMTTVIGEKYSTLNYTFGSADMNAFFARMREQIDAVAAWSDESIQRTKSTIREILASTGFLDKPTSNTLNPVRLCRTLENEMRGSAEQAALAAFNCFV